jgi:putative membrane protein
MELNQQKNKNFRRTIVVLSIGIPIVIALLFKIKIQGYDFSFLPPIYASINALTAFLLLVALVAIKRKNVMLHRKLMLSCMGLSLLFFVGYITYHSTSDPAVFGDIDANGVLDEVEKLHVSVGLKITYLLILVTHILLSIAVIPLVLISLLFALENNIARHKKWTKFTWPIWFYVAVSGVIVYAMISPYYPH